MERNSTMNMRQSYMRSDLKGMLYEKLMLFANEFP